MSPRVILISLLLGLLICVGVFSSYSASTGQTEDPRIKWSTVDADGNVEVHLYFFWSEHCPHCNHSQPFVEILPQVYPWLKLHSLSITDNLENVALYEQLANALGQEARSVPAFLFCGSMVTGYNDAKSTGRFLVVNLERCHRLIVDAKQAGTEDFTLAAGEVPITLPLLGQVDPEVLSLPMLTLVLAGLDSFNPCAFFILLFLLSLLVHARSRARMLVIGGIFVFFSGLLYFLFMTAWLNLFLVIGQMRWVTLGAGSVAVLVGLISVKDYVWFQRGITLSISAHAKPRLYKRIRTLISADSLPAMILGTVTLAIAANSYELLCTAGFPMVFTRILMMYELVPAGYYFYLAFYNLIYVIPLLVIVGLFAFTMGSRKLSEREGRVLKLLSGLMMVELGFVLLFVPAVLDNIFPALALVTVAILTTYTVNRLTQVHGGDQ